MILGFFRKKFEQRNTPRLTNTSYITFAHVLNPVDIEPPSDLVRAQPITFETMRIAREVARSGGVGVDQLAAFFPEDESIVPDTMSKCSPLESSCLDYANFNKQKKLPLFQEILDRALAASDAPYIIYTNADIALMPHFYSTSKALLEGGHDAIMIYRRTLSDSYTSVSEIPAMYADLGEDHPGTDCFIMKRELLEKVNLEKIVIGAQFCAFALRANLHALGRNVREYPRLHMTFHIGDDRVWESQNEYGSYNLSQFDRMFEELSGRGKSVDNVKLDNFMKQYENRKSAFERKLQESQN